MKLLHAADLHLDSPLTATPELRKALLSVPGMLAEICRREGCDAMLLAGDLFDGKWTRATADILCDALREAKVPVFISPGNHDCLAPDSPYSQVEWPENVYIFKENRITALTVPALDLCVYGAGYQSMDCQPLLEGFQAEGQWRYHIGLLHGDPTRVDSPYCPVTMAQVRESGLHYLAMGHLHKQGCFQAGDTLCAWPGCPMGRGFDEAGPKGVLIVTVEDFAHAEFVPLDLPGFHVQECTDEALLNLLPPVGNRDYYRITLTGEHRIEVGEVLEKFPNMELIDRRWSSEDLWKRGDADSLEGIFFRLLHQRTDCPERDLAARIASQLLDGEEVAL